MGLRTVGVKLMAECRDYITGVEASEKVTGDFADELAKAAKAGDETAMATEVFGKTAKTAAGHVEHLDHEIKQAKKELRELAIAFAEAETAADRADLSKSIRKAQGEISSLTKNQNFFKNLLPNEQNNPGIFKKFSSSISDSIMEGVSAGPWWAPVAAAAAPLIGGVISAAVIGAAGVGGVIGGVLLAARDPRVAAAGTALGQNLLGQLEKDADVFVGPVLANISKVEAAFGGMNDDIKKIFSGSAGFLNPLVNGILGAVKGILGGIESLVSKGKPVIDALGQTFTTIGSAVGDALTTIAGGSKSAATALTDFAGDVAVVIRGVGWAVRALTELYNAMMLPTHLETNWYFKYKTGIDYAAAKTPVATIAVNTLAGVLPNLAHKTKEYATAADAAAGAANGEREALGALYSELKAQTDPVFALIDAQKKLADAQKTYSSAVKAHGKKSAEAKAADLDLAKAALDLQLGVGNLSTTFNGKLSPAMLQTLHAAHLTDAQIAGISRQFADAKKSGDAYAKSYAATVSVKDFPTTQAKIKAIKDSLDGISGKTITIKVRADLPAGLALGNLLHRAGGGPVKAGVPYVVGEQRPEVFVPDQDGTIAPSVSSYMSGRSTAQSMPTSFGPQKVIVETRVVTEWVGGADAFGQLIANAFRVRPGLRATVAKMLAT